MELFDTKFHKAARPAFDDVPPANTVRLFGVDYVRLKGLRGGDLFVTRTGWGCVDSLLPQTWFVGEQFRKVGCALAGATGAVYRVPVPHRSAKDFALVVKFSRAAQDLGITVIGEGFHWEASEEEKVTDAEFLSPFKEFGNLHKLRSQTRTHPIRTMQPLGIYSPVTRYHDWQLGRKSHLCLRMNEELLASQQETADHQKIHYEWERLYILLYGWIDGMDAELAVRAGAISDEEMISLGRKARADLRQAGWMVCDHKPRHVIIRERRNKAGILRRHNEMIWALVDYELLVPL